MEKLVDWFQFLRLPNLIVVGLLIFFLQLKVDYLSYWVQTSPRESYLFWPLGWALTFGLICLTAAGNIINDLFDVRADRINKPNKVFINRLIGDDEALYLYFVLNTIAFCCAVYCVQGRWPMLGAFPFMVALLYFYSFFMKRIPLLGNVVIAGFCAGVPLTYAWVMKIATDYPLSELTNALAFFAFLSTLIREIIKDCEDFKGDKLTGCNTLPIALGFKNTNLIVAALLITLMACTLYLAYESKTWWFYLCVLPLLFAVIGILRANATEHYKFPSNALKVYMLMGIVGVLM